MLLDLTMSDISTLTVSSCVLRFWCLSHGLTVGSSFLTGLQILSGFFPELTDFWKKKKQKNPNKQTQAAHSSAAEERISRMINKNKTSSRSSLYLRRSRSSLYLICWKLLFTKLVNTHIDNTYFNGNRHETCWK